ncbi:MAG TPA: hypothetical protein VGB94_12350 [Acidobacteriaceae bacterium]
MPIDTPSVHNFALSLQAKLGLGVCTDHIHWRYILEAAIKKTFTIALLTVAAFFILFFWMLRHLGLSRILCAIGVHSWKNLVLRDVCTVCGKTTATYAAPQ